VNPKERFGAQKPTLALVPSAGIAAASLAAEDGAQKYGPYNWRDAPVSAMTYINAARRHLDAWVDGEAFASDSAIPNLGAVVQGISILLDAIACGSWIDDRPSPGQASQMHDAIKAWKADVAAGRDRHEAANEHLGRYFGQK
jgi:hypothetical protein